MTRLGLILAAIGLLAAACSGGGDGDAADGTGLRVPGRVVYTQGSDIFLQDSPQGGQADAGTVDPFVVAEERISLLSPTFSPDGSQVAYIAFDESVGLDEQIGSDLRIVGPDGADRIVRESAATGEFFWTPRWTRDGGGLIYAHQVQVNGGLGALFTVERLDLASLQIEELVRDARDPDLAPDGASLVVVADPPLNSSLAIVDLPAGTQRTLAAADDGLTSIRVPQFSPNGQSVAFLASGEGPSLSSRVTVAFNGMQDLWLIRPDGSGLRRLTTVLEDQPDFSWSDDGRHILLRGAFGTYVVEVETRTTTTLGPGEFHGWHDWQGTLPDETPAQAQ